MLYFFGYVPNINFAKTKNNRHLYFSTKNIKQILWKNGYWIWIFFCKLKIVIGEVLFRVQHQIFQYRNVLSGILSCILVKLNLIFCLNKNEHINSQLCLHVNGLSWFILEMNTNGVWWTSTKLFQIVLTIPQGLLVLHGVTCISRNI